MAGAVRSRAHGAPTSFLDAVWTVLRKGRARALEIPLLRAGAALIAIAAMAMSPAPAAGFQLTGKVTNISLTPIQDVDVVAKNPMNDQPVASGTTDGAGHFALSVPAGSYDVVLTPMMGSGFANATIPVVVNGDTDLGTQILYAVPTAVGFSGVLRDADGAPVANQFVELCHSFYNCPYFATTAADGSFSIGGIPPAPYYIYIAGSGGTLPAGFHVDGPLIDL